MLTVKRDMLLVVLQKITGIIQPQQTMPILSYILFNLENNKLTLSTTDLEIELIGTITTEIEVKETMQIMLPARKLLDICKALPPQSTLKFTRKDTKVIVNCGRSNFSLATLPVEEYTQFNEFQQQWEVKISQTNLLQLLKSTSFAMGSQDVRYYLNGLLLELHTNTLRAVATDGHRLALNNLYAKINTDHKTQIIVPHKAVTELCRLLEHNDTDVFLGVSSHQLRYSSASFTFTTKLIDARFPSYECALPIGLDKKIVVNRDSFRQTLSRVAILTNEKIKGIRLQLTKGIIQLSATNQEQEMATEDFDIEYEGDDINIAFNARYLLEAVQNCSTDKIELHFKDTATSMMIKEASADSQVTFVLMPLCLYQNVDSEYTPY